MAIEGLSRQAIRREVGKNLMGGEFVVSATTTAGGDASSVVDNNLFGGADRYNGWWILPASGETNAGEIRRVDDMAVDTPATGDRDLTIRPVFGANVPSGMDYELWRPEYPPARINEYINQAINKIIGRFYVREESQALHADGRTQRFDLPTEFQMVDRVEYRESVTGAVIHQCDRTFDETTDADFTQANDSQDQKLGQSLKFTVAAAAGAGDFITDSIGSLDLSRYTHLEGWVKSTVALSAADYQIRLDNGVVQGNSTDLEILDVPAATAGVWTYFRMALANPQSDIAIVSIGIEMNVDKGAHVVWFDDLKAVDIHSANWVKLPKQTWRLDEEADDLILSDAGRWAAGYHLLKLSGGSHPAQLTADSGVSTVPESFIIAYATYLALMGGSRASDNDPDGRRTMARDWLAISEREAGKFSPLIDARKAA